VLSCRVNCHGTTSAVEMSHSHVSLEQLDQLTLKKTYHKTIFGTVGRRAYADAM